MNKLSYEDKIEVYKKKQVQSRYILARKYNIRDCNISYIVSLINKHGYDILRTIKNKNIQNNLRKML